MKPREMSHPIKSEFLLDPDVVYLNHGSYGACPRPVFKTYQDWQRELERQPVSFINERLPGLMTEARAELAAYLGVTANDVVYFANPTTAVKMICRSLQLGPGDEVLTTNYEYPAMDATWDFVAYKTGVKYVHQMIPLPLTSTADTVEAIWSGVNERTRIIFISHIAAFTALTFPVREICHRARRAGIVTFIDGAHAPGQIPLDLAALDADIYIGACHKWMCAPKGSGFAYVHPDFQDRIVAPLVVSRSRGARSLRGPDGASLFAPTYQAQGTRDPSSFLSVPAAIKFQEQNHWDEHRCRCHALASQTRARVNTLTGLEPLCPDSPQFFGQMVSFYIPDACADSIRQQLVKRRIVAVLLHVNDRYVMRVSFQAYNSQQDADLLVEAIAEGLTL
jgi:isopenicillin-N epimerase